MSNEPLQNHPNRRIAISSQASGSINEDGIKRSLEVVPSTSLSSANLTPLPDTGEVQKISSDEQKMRSLHEELVRRGILIDSSVPIKAQVDSLETFREEPQAKQTNRESSPSSHYSQESDSFPTIKRTTIIKIKSSQPNFNSQRGSELEFNEQEIDLKYLELINRGILVDNSISVETDLEYRQGPKPEKVALNEFGELSSKELDDFRVEYPLPLAYPLDYEECFFSGPLSVSLPRNGLLDRGELIAYWLPQLRFPPPASIARSIDQLIENRNLLLDSEGKIFSNVGDSMYLSVPYSRLPPLKVEPYQNSIFKSDLETSEIDHTPVINQPKFIATMEWLNEKWVALKSALAEPDSSASSNFSEAERAIALTFVGGKMIYHHNRILKGQNSGSFNENHFREEYGATLKEIQMFSPLYFLKDIEKKIEDALTKMAVSWSTGSGIIAEEKVSSLQSLLIDYYRGKRNSSGDRELLADAIGILPEWRNSLPEVFEIFAARLKPVLFALVEASPISRMLEGSFVSDSDPEREEGILERYAANQESGSERSLLRKFKLKRESLIRSSPILGAILEARRNIEIHFVESNLANCTAGELSYLEELARIDPQALYNKGVSSSPSVVLGNGENRSQYLHRTFAVAFAGRYQLSGSEKSNRYPIYMKRWDVSPKVYFNSLRCSIIDRQIEDAVRSFEPNVDSEHIARVREASSWRNKITVAQASELLSDFVTQRESNLPEIGAKHGISDAMMLRTVFSDLYDQYLKNAKMRAAMACKIFSEDWVRATLHRADWLNFIDTRIIQQLSLKELSQLGEGNEVSGYLQQRLTESFPSLLKVIPRRARSSV